MADFGLSECAMFFMHSAGFASFQRVLEKGAGRSHRPAPFGIANIPSDKDIRDMLEEADPVLAARPVWNG
jgi:hypothetical protein